MRPNPNLRSVRWLLALALFILLWVSSYALALFLREQLAISLWFPPAALTFAFLVRFGWRHGYVPLSAALIAELLFGAWGSALVWPELLAILIHVTAYGLGAEIARRSRSSFGRCENTTLKGFLVGSTTGAILAATGGTLIFTQVGVIPSSVAFGAFEGWALGDLIAVISLTPIILLYLMPVLIKLAGDEPRPLLEAIPRITSSQWNEQLLLLLVAGGVLFGLITDPQARANWSFLLFLPAIFIAVRQPGAPAAVFVALIVSTYAFLAAFVLPETRLAMSQGILLSVAGLTLVLTVAFGELKQREEEVQKAKAELEQEGRKRQTLESAAQQHRHQLEKIARVGSLREISAAMAHDINQPLTVIRSLSQEAVGELEKIPADTEKLNKWMKAIIEQSGRISELVKEHPLTGVPVEESGGPTDLNEVIAETLDSLMAMASLTNIDIKIELAEEPLQVNSDRAALELILVNLVFNAVEALEDQEDEKIITVRSYRTGIREAGLLIVDNGPGIAAEKRTAVFDPFYSSKPGGSGLGLATCRTIVESLGGSIRAHEADGGGAAFVVRLPSRRQQAEEEFKSITA